MTSGNLVGVRGQVTYVGASGGFIYGAQSVKSFVRVPLTSSEWSSRYIWSNLIFLLQLLMVGKLPQFGSDYGSTSGTLTSETGCYGIAMTNTTAVVTIGQLYRYALWCNQFNVFKY